MKKLKVAAVPLCGLLALAGCGRQAATQTTVAPPEPAVKAAPPTPIAEKKEELGQPSWDPQWDVVVERALPADMLSARAARSVKSYCPRFGAMSEADKRAFWAYTFQALAGAEAGLTPTTDVRHTEPEVAVKDTVTNGGKKSTGLMYIAAAGPAYVYKIVDNTPGNASTVVFTNYGKGVTLAVPPNAVNLS